jgi:hypothetical protein
MLFRSGTPSIILLAEPLESFLLSIIAWSNTNDAEDAEVAEGRCAPTQKTAEKHPAGTLGGTRPFF